VKETDQLHVQFMNEQWGSGNPTASLQNGSFLAYDDHRSVCESLTRDRAHLLAGISSTTRA
jgi:hypothetical protein